MNTQSTLYLGDTPLYHLTKSISLVSETYDGERYFKIVNYDSMKPFFMTIVSDTDHWMFISSNGGLTCGRKSPDNALFPYYTDDKIHDSKETTGPDTVMVVTKNDKQYLWKPFSDEHKHVYKQSRHIYKNALGNKIIFEVVNEDLGISYRYKWSSSAKYGFIKTSTVTNLLKETVTVKVLDGIRNILPDGVHTLLQTTKSTLVDGYKRCELIQPAGLGIYTLSSILTDKAEPSESLKATTVWSSGLTSPTYLVCEEQVDIFASNRDITTELDIKGKRGAYYVADEFLIESEGSKSWQIVAELNQSIVTVEDLISDLEAGTNLEALVAEDIAKGDANLKALVYQADGLQNSEDEMVNQRHFSNTLFNIMRGGIYSDGYQVGKADVIDFIKTWNLKVYKRHADLLSTLEDHIDYSDLQSIASETHDKDFIRLTMEYLPLTYSRRHGDPSRPWNQFNIDIASEDGGKKLKYEGNWRDIFQNWEALSLSYPLYIESIIAKFVNASTADGYNPYRITRDGIDWELLDPEDPWSNIGYWGDHQLIYLLKMMELSNKYNPSKLKAMMEEEVFVYANVPYRIKGFDDLVKDPRNSIRFDDALEDRVQKLYSEIGADGKLIHQSGETYKVTLMEKLLVTLLSKFSNYVPDGGIWMNTQRPEWNDANNALVGNGLSMVTLYYLHRFQGFMAQILETLETDSFKVSEVVYDMFMATSKLFESVPEADVNDKTRYEWVEALGRIGETYRNNVYESGFSGSKVELSTELVKSFTSSTLAHLKQSIKNNKRTDGLYHAYNLIRFNDDSCSVDNLYEMLEGQVSVLSSNALSPSETLDVLEALKVSSIYRQDQNSYMLYPNRALSKFREKNQLSKAQLDSSDILKKELEKGLTRFIEIDKHGHYHFNGSFRNSEEITDALMATGEFSDKDISQVGELFAQVFNHHAFTGRSGTFYKYEGLGCIYWHMVSKLLVTTQENLLASYDNCDDDMRFKLTQAFEAIKAGIGLKKSPENYGAFTTDAYSHTPGFAGVQQPGMTGQVKEDFIVRYAELGLLVSEGLISFSPKLLKQSEFRSDSSVWQLPRGGNYSDKQTIEMSKGELGFTVCGIPVVYQLTDKVGTIVTYTDGNQVRFDNENTLSQSVSNEVFNRSSKIELIRVSINKKDMI